MSDLLQNLKKRGCDTEGAMERFLDDREFYRECLVKVLHDRSFEDLKKALEEHRMEDAFHCAHTLKGLLANMGLTPLQDMVAGMVEPLREGNSNGLMKTYEELITELGQYKKLI